MHVHTKKICRRLFASSIMAAILFLGCQGVADAHVKWFQPYDLTAPPAPPGRYMLDPIWLLGLGLSLPALWLCITADTLADRFFKAPAAVLRAVDFSADRLIRLSLGLWLSWLWLLPTPIWLTPELTTADTRLQWVQLVLAAFCLSSRTAWVAGLGIAGLWLGATRQYGIYHLLDYPLFLGFAALLIAGSLHGTRLGRQGVAGWLVANRHGLLVVSMACTLMWAAVEKWAFAAWSLPLLCSRPWLTMGMAPEVFLPLSGWLEFGAAAMLMLGGTASSRMSAALLFPIFVSAVLEFGRVDLVGHFPIIVTLLVTACHGNGRIAETVNLRHLPPLERAIWLPPIYGLALIITNIAYIGGWQSSYGAPGTVQGMDEYHLARLLMMALIVAGLMLAAIGAARLLGTRQHRSF
ncbi:hypothetical protein ACQ3G6_02185 [Allorhizobium undicola]|uniref:hypothetical protein n=1 Tax=Allorhizobium undicola TaxID=78527 RepID=UPI000482E871|nr:hypothetical protein [Allorhizobium undicola]